MKRVHSSRKRFLGQCARGMALLFFGSFFSYGCKPKANDEVQAPTSGDDVPQCERMDNISEADVALRVKFGYVKESPIADNQCQNCNLFLPPKADEKCGGCMLFKGPVYPEAYCTYWAPRV